MSNIPSEVERQVQETTQALQEAIEAEKKSAEDGKWRVQKAEYNIPSNVLRSLRMVD